MKEEKSYLSAKYDVVFKRVFADQRNADIIAAFLGSVLGITDDLTEITKVDPHLKKENEDDKLAILDLKLKTGSGRTINCEIQLYKLKELKSRIIYYTSKMVTEQLQTGNKYNRIKPVVSIVITDFNFIVEDDSYKHTYEMVDDEKGIRFDDTLKIVTLELPKLPPVPDQSDLWFWMKFFKSEKKEEFDMLVKESADNKEIKKAVAIVAELSQDEKARMLADREEMQRRDYISRLEDAEAEGVKKGITKGMNEKALDIAKNMLKNGLPDDDIIKMTGITSEELNKIK